MSREMNNGFDEWGGYMAAKITKLEEQFSEASNPFRKSNLFAGISIFVNGLTYPSADELKRLMMVHGGTYHHYERSHTTYIIASNLPDVKVRNMNTSKIISPKWVVDCLQEQRILDYTRYLLYTNENRTQPRINFSKTKKEDESKMNILSNDDNCAVKKQKQLEERIRDKSEHEQKISTTSRSDALTAVDPKFLSEFYNNSRLHHIATLGAGFKQYISELRAKHCDDSFPALEDLKMKLIEKRLTKFVGKSTDCYVMHIDMDCFFVSVGLRNHPELRGHPLAVTHSKGGAAAKEVPVHQNANREVEMELLAKRFEQQFHDSKRSDKVRSGFDAKMSLSEIASCSYEARAKGIKNGMFVGQAMILCPELKTIPYDFVGYREVAFTLYDTIAQYTLSIEAVSCDEMFVDLTDLIRKLEVHPLDFVTAVRAEVKEKTGCPCSAGIGTNKLQARMATKRAKPDGQYHLDADNVVSYMIPIAIDELPGVGSSIAYTLNQAGIFNCGDLQKVSLAKIQMHVGKKLGETLYNFCRGIDNRSLIYGQVRKSISAEVNYGIRFKNAAELETFIRQLCTEVHARLIDIKRKTKCLTLKIMIRAQDAPIETSKFLGHGVCDNITKSVSLLEFTNDLEIITRTTLALMKTLSLAPNELRGIGIQLSKLNNEPNENKEKANTIKNLFNKVVDKRKEKDDGKSNVKFQSVSSSTKNSEDSKPAFQVAESKPHLPTRVESTKHPNILCLLQNAANKTCKIPSERDANKFTIIGDIDPEVLAALPDNIRAEILNDRAQRSDVNQAYNIYAPSQTLNLKPSTSKAALGKSQRLGHYVISEAEQVDAEFLDALPPVIRNEIKENLNHQKVLKIDKKCSYTVSPPPTIIEQASNDILPIINLENIFTQSNCNQLLLAWVKSSEEPEKYDIDLISGHAAELVRAKKLNQLYDSLLYLCRLIKRYTTNHCGWHVAVKMIIEAVQLEMRHVYDGRKLFLVDILKCDSCKI